MLMDEAMVIELDRIWGHPGSLYGPRGEDDALALDGVHPLPGMTIEELGH